VSKRSFFERIETGGLVVDEVRQPAGRVLRDHAHEGVKIGIVLAGGVTERRDGQVRTVRAGEVFVRRAGVRHANQYDPSGARLLFVELAPDDGRAPLVARADGLVRAELGAAAGRLVRAVYDARGGGRADVLRGVEALVSEAARLRPRAGPSWLEAARDRLAEQWRRPPSLGELAAELRVHPVHLAQAFRARWGLAPGAFVRAHRVFHAVSLAHRGVPLCDVAGACGFADQSHMTRAVRALRGSPPGRLVRANVSGRRLGWAPGLARTLQSGASGVGAWGRPCYAEGAMRYAVNVRAGLSFGAARRERRGVSWLTRGRAAGERC
jgi:AraC family transcriptional regulator